MRLTTAEQEGLDYRLAIESQRERARREAEVAASRALHESQVRRRARSRWRRRAGTLLFRNRWYLLAAAVVVFFLWGVWPTPWRYGQVRADGADVMVRTHRITGTTQILAPPIINQWITPQHRQQPQRR